MTLPYHQTTLSEISEEELIIELENTVNRFKGSELSACLRDGRVALRSGNLSISCYFEYSLLKARNKILLEYSILDGIDNDGVYFNEISEIANLREELVTGVHRKIKSSH